MTGNDDSRKTDFEKWLNEHELCNGCLSKGGCPHKAPIERILSCPAYKPLKNTNEIAEILDYLETVVKGVYDNPDTDEEQEHWVAGIQFAIGVIENRICAN